MTLSDFVKKAQEAMNKKGAHLTVDGDPGPHTRAEMADFDFSVEANRRPEKATSSSEAPPWYNEAKKYEGKNENDPAFNKFMSSKWKLLGLNLGTIAKNWAAWCGLAAAVALAGVGLNYQHNGAAAKNWDKFGVAIEWKTDGIPRGAFIRINHKGDCKSTANNHITQADGNCAPVDLLKPGARFNGYGGNQSNTWKVSSFPVSDICAVRWPADYQAPPKITQSDHCSGSSGTGSTR